MWGEHDVQAKKNYPLPSLSGEKTTRAPADRRKEEEEEETEIQTRA